MSQLKQPIFLKKIKKVINTIPGLEEQIFACRNKKRSDNPLLFIDRKDEEWICPYISRHLLSLNPLLACCRRYSRGER